MKKGFPALLLLAVLIGFMAAPPAFASEVQVQRIEASGGNVYAYTAAGIVTFARIAHGFSVNGFQIIVRSLESSDPGTRRIEMIVGLPWSEVSSEFVWVDGQFVGASNFDAVRETLLAFSKTLTGATLDAVGKALSPSALLKHPTPLDSCGLCLFALAMAITAMAFACATGTISACAEATAVYGGLLVECDGACYTPTPEPCETWDPNCLPGDVRLQPDKQPNG